MSLFFYLFPFSINLWHRKFVTADVTEVFVSNQHGIQRRGQDFVQLYCSRRLQSSLHPTCGCQTARTWIQSTTVSRVSCRNEFTRQQCAIQLISNSASLRLNPAFHRLSSTKPLTSWGYDYKPASKQRDVSSSTRRNQPDLFRATHILAKKLAMPSYTLIFQIFY